MENDVLPPADREAVEAAVDEVSEGSSGAVVYIGSDADYTEQLQAIHDDLNGLQEITGNIEGFLIFAAVVALCWFSYKFLRLFF